MDDLSSLGNQFKRNLENYFAEPYNHLAVIGVQKMQRYVPPIDMSLDDPWFWPDDVQPMSRELPNEQLEPFWR